MKRSYGQYSALAKALDVVGGRWTLLVVRELLAGPRRFKDLLDGLPGIGTSLLSERLRELQQADVIAQRTLPPPAGSTVYELTERGRDLAPAAVALERWGFELMDAPAKDEEFRVHWLLTAGTAGFRPEMGRGTTLVCELRTSESDVAHLRIEDGELQIVHGPAIGPDISISAEPRQLIDLLSGKVPLAKARRNGVDFEGEQASFDRLLAIFERPEDRPGD